MQAATAAIAALAPAAMADATPVKDWAAAIGRLPICGASGPVSDQPVGQMVMVDGFGSGGFRVDTVNPLAQTWFDHGVRLRWAFEHAEAVRAFRMARRLDPQCGMCAWGEAWAIGPNPNGGGGDPKSIAAGLAAARDAKRLAQDASPAQRRMIDAMIIRYTGRPQSRADRFAKAMDRIVRRYPDDVALITITADAWMMRSAGDWWDKDGKAREPGVTRAMTLLEHALERKPDDPGAIHLYIHLTEWSDDPHRALAYGEKLAKLAPGSSHLVHMPSHTFYRVGRYRAAMESNLKAVALDRRYDQLARPPGGVKGMMLHAHNIHFGIGGALMAGGAEQGLALADWFMRTYPHLLAAPGAQDDHMATFRQIIAADAYAAYGRFGSDAQVAALPQPHADRPLMRVGWRYARGEAAARRGEASVVRAEAKAIGDLIALKPFTGSMIARQAEIAEVLQRVLEGRAAMLEGDYRAAVTAYSQAAALQARHPEGGDPPLIWYPTRRSLAAALLASGDAPGAKARIEELIKDWPADPYSYFVLAQAEAALGREKEAADARRLARSEWIGGAMTLSGA